MQRLPCSCAGRRRSTDHFLLHKHLVWCSSRCGRRWPTPCKSCCFCNCWQASKTAQAHTHGGRERLDCTGLRGLEDNFVVDRRLQQPQCRRGCRRWRDGAVDAPRQCLAPTSQAALRRTTKLPRRREWCASKVQGVRIWPQGLLDRVVKALAQLHEPPVAPPLCPSHVHGGPPEGTLQGVPRLPLDLLETHDGDLQQRLPALADAR
mmetsp:Transcript_167058/g.536434  ORF Transcript_167058/g.536434 Transcript_167058/m.536434 type:complete len:206 (+) Transcript_167058:2111-2728(+)